MRRGCFGEWEGAVDYHLEFAAGNIGAPSVFRYEDVPDPECRPGGVLIDAKAIGIQGGDTLNRAGGALVTHPHSKLRLS